MNQSHPETDIFGFHLAAHLCERYPLPNRYVLVYSKLKHKKLNRLNNNILGVLYNVLMCYYYYFCTYHQKSLDLVNKVIIPKFKHLSAQAYGYANHLKTLYTANKTSNSKLVLPPPPQLPSHIVELIETWIIFSRAFPTLIDGILKGLEGK